MKTTRNEGSNTRIQISLEIEPTTKTYICERGGLVEVPAATAAAAGRSGSLGMCTESGPIAACGLAAAGEQGVGAGPAPWEGVGERPDHDTRPRSEF